MLLADEPVAGLDPASAKRILDLLADICRAGTLTAVLSLHQVEMARAYPDRVVGLGRRAGRVRGDAARPQPGRARTHLSPVGVVGAAL